MTDQLNASEPDPLGVTLARSTEVLFLCSGNILRSAFAELYGRHLGLTLPVRSGATVYRNGYGPHPETLLALRARGVPTAAWADFAPTHLDDVLATLSPGTLVFGMTHEHLSAVAGEPLAGAHLLASLLGEQREIADPLFDGRYRECFGEIAACVEALGERLRPS